MKTKRVNRYYCEFCKKAGCSGGHIKRHEDRCTMNPNRQCGVCGKLLEQEQPNIDMLKGLLPGHKECVDTMSVDGDTYVSYRSDVLNTAYRRIMDAAGGCPNCTAAAFRQAGLPLRAVTAFDWGAEMAAIWAEINNDNCANDWQ